MQYGNTIIYPVSWHREDVYLSIPLRNMSGEWCSLLADVDHIPSLYCYHIVVSGGVLDLNISLPNTFPFAISSKSTFNISLSISIRIVLMHRTSSWMFLKPFSYTTQVKPTEAFQSSHFQSRFVFLQANLAFRVVLAIFLCGDIRKYSSASRLRGAAWRNWCKRGRCGYSGRCRSVGGAWLSRWLSDRWRRTCCWWDLRGRCWSRSTDKHSRCCTIDTGHDMIRSKSFRIRESSRREFMMTDWAFIFLLYLRWSRQRTST